MKHDTNRTAPCGRELILLLGGAAVHILASVCPMPTSFRCIGLVAAVAMLLFNVGRWRNEWMTSLRVCLVSAICMITVCSKSSFLYPFNDWSDANCFFTVGKSMMNGSVIYRDLLEQKGPFLYAIHAVAWLISGDTFTGVYLIEVWAAAFFLFWSHRAIR